MKERAEQLVGVSAWSDDQRRVRVRIGVVVLGYLGYAGLALGLPGRMDGAAADRLEASAFREGRAVWTAARCQACHSVYGLGGHLGPDLTNILSRRGPDVVLQNVLNGRPGMPATPLDEYEQRALLDYLAEIDRSGRYPPVSGAVFGDRP